MTPEVAKQAGSHTEPSIELTFLSHFRNLCREGKELYENTFKIPFEPAWFGLPSNGYNPGLAYAGMGICLCGYENWPSNDFKYIKGALAAVGLKDIDISAYYHRTYQNYIDVTNNINIVSSACGHMPITLPDGTQKELVIAMARGTSKSIEWNSNSNVADSVTDDNYDIGYHEGFKRSADETYANIWNYINKIDCDLDNTVLWLIGHSRGAAIINLVAAMFDEGKPTYNFDDTRFSQPKGRLPKERIYAYSFSASPGTRRADAQSSAFDNIFNIVNPEDYIPRIPPLNWDFKRFGRDLFFPSIATSYDQYRLYHERFLEQFKEWTRIDFPAFHGFERTNMFDRCNVNIARNAYEMYDHLRFSEGGTITYAQYFHIFTDLAGKVGLKRMVPDMGRLAKYGVGILEVFLNFFLKNQIMGNFAPGAHQEEGYLAKFMLCYEMDIDIEQNATCDTQRFTVYGPASLVVRNADGDVVAHIEKGKRDESLYEKRSDYLAMYADHQTKTNSVWIPDNGEYTIEILAELEEEFDVTIARQAPLGQVLEQTTYKNVPLRLGEWVKWDDVRPGAPSYTAQPDDAIDIEPVIKVDGKQMRASDAINAWKEHGSSMLIEDAMPVPLIVADVLCERNIMPGCRVALRAFHGKHLRFGGWYAKGADPEVDEPLCKEPIYIVSVDGPIELEAHFKR